MKVECFQIFIENEIYKVIIELNTIRIIKVEKEPLKEDDPFYKIWKEISETII